MQTLKARLFSADRCV